MAAASRKSVEVKTFPQPKKRAVRLANDEDLASPSPALERQMALLEKLTILDGPAPDPGKWSQRRTAAFLLLTCGGFWTCVILGAVRLLR